MNDTDLMKLMDLSAKLGLALGVNPVWVDEYVIYRDGLDDDYDDYIELSFDRENGCWVITTGDFGMLNLPKEAPELMGRMSKIIEGDNDD